MIMTGAERRDFSFVHIADVHLDTSFLGRTAQLRRRLRSAVRKALRAAVDLAIDEQVHALLIAGDLFDGERLSFETERFLVVELRRLEAEGIQVLYATGNHDPGSAGARAAAIAWPPNVRLFHRRRPETVEIKDRDGSIVGKVTSAGHEGRAEQENLAAVFPRADAAAPHVAMLHATVVGSQAAEAHERYAPCAVEELRGKGFAYWALGHIHKRQLLPDLPLAQYPGNLQGRNPKETGSKGALLVKIPPGGEARVEFRPLASIQWASLHLDGLDGVNNMEDLVERAVEDFGRHAVQSDTQDKIEWMVSLELTGSCPVARRLCEAAIREGDGGLGALEEEIAAATGALSVRLRPDRLTRPVDLEACRVGPHALAEALAVIDRARSDDALIDALAPDRLAGISGGEGDEDEDAARRRYLRGLLEGLDVEAAGRMLKLNDE